MEDEFEEVAGAQILYGDEPDNKHIISKSNRPDYCDILTEKFALNEPETYVPDDPLEPPPAPAVACF